MSMLSSLDALDAAAEAATAAPRAAVFQPKVKPRTRKGGGGGSGGDARIARAPAAAAAAAAPDSASNAAPADVPPATPAEDKDRPPLAAVDDSPPARQDSPDGASAAPDRSGADSPRPPPVPAAEEARGMALSPEESDAAAVDDSAGLRRESGDGQASPRESAEEERSGAAADEEAGPVADVVYTRQRVASRKRKAFSHTTSRSRMNRKEREGVSPKIDLSKTDLSDPGKLTMREIIRRAEAIERKKVKVGAKKGDEAKQECAAAEKQQRQQQQQQPASVSMAPQVQIVDGRIVINEQSLTVGAFASTRQNTDAYRRVEENASRLNYNSYSNRTPAERWKPDDTDVFYRALQQFGTDFELIQNLFPGRTRRQVKAKFKKEERSNPRRLQDALAFRPKDQAHYTDMITRLKADDPEHSGDDEPLAKVLPFTSDASVAEQQEGEEL